MQFGLAKINVEHFVRRERLALKTASIEHNVSNLTFEHTIPKGACPEVDPFKLRIAEVTSLKNSSSINSPPKISSGKIHARVEIPLTIFHGPKHRAPQIRSLKATLTERRRPNSKIFKLASIKKTVTEFAFSKPKMLQLAGCEIKTLPFGTLHERRGFNLLHWNAIELGGPLYT